jgi:hypothetical protein
MALHPVAAAQERLKLTPTRNHSLDAGESRGEASKEQGKHERAYRRTPDRAHTSPESRAQERQQLMSASNVRLGEETTADKIQQRNSVTKPGNQAARQPPGWIKPGFVPACGAGCQQARPPVPVC